MKIKRSFEGGRGKRRKRSLTIRTTGTITGNFIQQGLASFQVTKTSRIIVDNHPVTTAVHYVSQPLIVLVRAVFARVHRRWIGKRLETRSSSRNFKSLVNNRRRPRGENLDVHNGAR